MFHVYMFLLPETRCDLTFDSSPNAVSQVWRVGAQPPSRFEVGLQHAERDCDLIPSHPLSSRLIPTEVTGHSPTHSADSSRSRRQSFPSLSSAA